MISLHLTVPDEERDEVIAELWELGTAGVTEESGGLRAFFEEDVDLASRFSAYKPVVTEEEERDWVRESRDTWQPDEVGRKWFLVPEWRNDPAPAGRLRLTIYPGLACGTGRHPATRLCLEAMEAVVAPGSRVLDVGTGSGILAQAARLLGASFVAGCDIEHSSTEVAAENGRRSGIHADLFTGSPRSVKQGSFDVLVANLNAAALAQLAAEFRRIGGRLVLAGFRDDEVDHVCRLLSAAPDQMLEEDGWACVVIAG